MTAADDDDTSNKSPIKNSRRAIKAGAHIGLFQPGAQPHQKLTNEELAELAQAVGKTVGKTKKLAGIDGRSFPEDFSYSINSYVNELIQTPQLPTQREVATQLQEIQQELAQVRQEFIKPLQQIVGLIDRLENCVFAPDRLRTFIASGLFPEVEEMRSGMRDMLATMHPIIDIPAALGRFSLKAAERSDQLESAASKKGRRPAFATSAFLYSTRAELERAGVDVALPGDSASDTAEDYPLFRVARLGLKLAERRINPVPEELADVLACGKLQLVRKIREAR
jgi:hypothetical protein